MKSKKFIPPPPSVDAYNYAVRMPIGKLSNVTREAILEGRATMVMHSGIRAKIIAQG